MWLSEFQCITQVLTAYADNLSVYSSSNNSEFSVNPIKILINTVTSTDIVFIFSIDNDILLLITKWQSKQQEQPPDEEKGWDAFFH